MENEKKEIEKEDNKEEIKETKSNSEQKEDKKIEDNKEQIPKNKKEGFFKKVWNSITKIEKYPEMAAQGLGKAFTYICKVVAILAIILCLGMIYQAYQILQEGVSYIQNEFPEFSYKDGVLTVNSETPITISAEDSYVGETIIDTITEDNEVINKYIKQVEDYGDGIIVLKDRVIVKNGAITGTIEYEYKQMLEQMGINEFQKQDVINYINSPQILNIYVSIFITIFVYSFAMYLLTTLSNAVFLAVFGYLTTWIAKIRMRFVAVFNMAIYSLTLSIILNMIYIAINIFIPFNMEYFQVMYVTVAAIYLIAAIFLLKSEYIKRQVELMKIAEAQEIVRKELEEKEQEEENKKREEEKKKRKEKDKKKKKKEQDKQGQEPEGSNAKYINDRRKTTNEQKTKRAKQQTITENVGVDNSVIDSTCYIIRCYYLLNAKQQK